MKNCPQCSSLFEITDSDRRFYLKMNVPEPALCPDCRQQRRLAVRNEVNFYRRECGICKKKLVSVYSSDKPFKQLCNECFFGDKWNALEYGRDFDFSRPFFEQFNELRNEIPRMNNGSLNCVNCDYTNYTGDSKNCYITVATEKSEDCYYSKLCQNSKDCIDSDYIWDSEICYGCINVSNCFNCVSGYQLEECSDCYFGFDLKGCKNCLFCYNLRNNEYCVLNEKVGKEEFQKKIEKLGLDTHSGFQKAYLKWRKIISENAIHKAVNIVNCEDCTGDNLKNCRNMKECYDMQESEGCSYCWEGDAKFSYDCNNLYYQPELCYEIMSMLENYNSKFVMFAYYSNNIQYCDLCHYCNDIFGCAGLIRGKYCILNKQYTKDEYEELVSKIIEHMKRTDEYGEFFPISISPFAYNETIAQEYFPMTKEEALKKGWKWKDKENIIGDTIKTISADQLPDSIDDIADEVLNWAIECEISKRPFKIVSQELKFYREHNLAIPHFHPEERHKKRMELKNQRKLYNRKCAKCGASIQTAYSPDRPEKVYCEQCYLETVYCRRGL
jgi:hypothetical protein